MAEQNISTKQVCSGKSYVHIRRVRDFPKLILNHQVGHRNEFFRSKVSDGDCESTLSLVLYPGGYDDEHSDRVAIRASLDHEIDDCRIVVEVAICGRDNEECFKRRIVLTKLNNHREVVKDFVGKAVLLNAMDLLRDNDVLKIACRVSVDHEESILDDAERLATGYRQVHAKLYGRLLDSGDFSDFALKVGDNEFAVHKCILASHSPVFAAMFRSDMSEKNRSTSVIEDVEADTLGELLRFVYTAQVDQLDERAVDLWIAADKYEVNALRELCEQSLIEKLSVRNIAETLRLLDRFTTMCKLKAAAIQCIIDNAEVIAADGNFKEAIKKLSSNLLSDVLCASLTKTTTGC